MNETNDTIAAIATAPGPGGISVIRVAGPGSLELADKVFQCHGKKPSERDAGSFVHGHVVAGAAILDEAILLIYRAPHSYTCEDAIEIQAHGGAINAQRILQATLNAGARLAEAGEFTKRAFLNGRLDLVQAEAVADLVAAKSERAARAAVEQLEGQLSRELEGSYQDMIGIAADMEAALDFPEDELPQDVGAALESRIAAARARLEQMLLTWKEGHMLRDGVFVVIAGQPNAGKSTLLNRLLGRDRAIVADMPGTTRDTIEEQLVMNGILVKLVDTAGLRPAECEVEADGIDRARRQIDKADIVLFVMDGSNTLGSNDIYADLKPDRRWILIVNKIDRGLSPIWTGSSPPYRGLSPREPIYCSMKTGEGFDRIVECLSREVSRQIQGEPHSVISERHKQYIQYAVNALYELNNINSDDMTLKVQCIKTAVESIAVILGKTYSEDILTQIFSRFCIGK